jgi:HEAT repeat protein
LLTVSNFPASFLDALMKSAEHDENERVRAFSTRVLGKLRRGDLIELLRRLLKDESQFVRHNAVWALGELDDQESISEILRLQEDDPSPRVRQVAIEALKGLGRRGP